MKLWGIIRKDHKITQDVTIELPAATRRDVRDWSLAIGDVCRELDLARPVILKKHLADIDSFSRVVFRPEDFMEPVSFDRFEIELFEEKKKK